MEQDENIKKIIELERNRLRKQKSRANETPEQREIRLQKGRNYKRVKTQMETEAAKAIQREKAKNRAREKRNQESEAERALRREKCKILARQKRQSESDAERALRLEKIRISAQERRRNESNDSFVSKQEEELNSDDESKDFLPQNINIELLEEKALRLEKARIYKRERIQNETEIEKKIRLEKAKMHKREMFKKETEYERKIRLEKAKLYKREQKKYENEIERKIRLEKERSQRLKETDFEREIRLEKQRHKYKRSFNLNESIKRRAYEGSSNYKDCTDRISYGLTISDLKLLEKGENSVLKRIPNHPVEDPLSIKIEKDIEMSSISMDTLNYDIYIKREPSVELDKEAIKMNADNLSIHQFKCSQCTQSFEYRSSLIVHELEHKPKVRCMLCSQNVFVDKMDEHRTLHSEDKIFPCKTCSKIFLDKSSLKFHEKEHKMEEKVIEEEIAKRKEQAAIETEVEAAIKPKSFKCAHCSVKFPFKLRLIEHLFRDHVGAAEEKCKKCEFKSFSKSLVETHAITHISKNLLRCQKCKIEYKIPQQMKHHLSHVHGCFQQNRKYQCDLCGLEVRTLYKMRCHLLSKHIITQPEQIEELKIHHCHLCNRKYMKKGNLDYHIRYFHSDSFLLKCKKCDFSTKDLVAMKKHHSSEIHRKGIIKCDQCGMDFSQRSKYTDHYDSVHLKKQKYQCPLCESAFAYSQSLRDHMLFFHGGMNRFKCPLCRRSDGYTFKFLDSEDKFREHMSKKHGVENINVNDHAYKSKGDGAPRRSRKKPE